MKLPALIILVVLSIKGFAQDDTTLNLIFPVKNGKVCYDTSVNINTSLDEAFNKAKRWIINNQNQSENNPIFDKEDHLINSTKTLLIPIVIPNYNKDGGLQTEWNYSFIVRITFDATNAHITATNLMISGNDNTKSIPLETFIPYQQSIDNAAHIKASFGKRFKNAVYDSYRLTNQSIRELISRFSASICSKST